MGTWILPGECDSHALARRMRHVMHTFRLTGYRPSVVTDHEQRMGAACKNVLQYDWHGCNTHRINLGVKKALRDLPIMIRAMLDNVHLISSKICKSTKLWERLKAIQEDLLENDSTYQHGIPIPVHKPVLAPTSDEDVSDIGTGDETCQEQPPVPASLDSPEMMKYKGLEAGEH